jgi:hypothetical protein
MTIKTYCVCAGNYTTFPGGRPTTESEPELIAYLDSLKGTPPSSWRNTDLTPRRAFGPGQHGVDLGGKLVWGQSCKGIRHFDCVGFISYCLWKASGAVLQFDISQWRTPASGGKVYELDLKSKVRPSAPMDGDILIKQDHHIAFVSAKGAIIEAQDTNLGVRATGIFKLDAPGEWTHLVRLAGGGSSELAWPMGWWRVWDGGTWFYYLGPNGVAMSSKTMPLNTRTAPAKAHNIGTWAFSPPKTLVVRWKQVVGAPKPCEETFYNADKDCGQMNANSNLYSPLVATRME